jgi:hypothetical protein
LSVRSPSVAADRFDDRSDDTEEAVRMVIDCDRCMVRGDACGDCVVGVLLGVPGVPGSTTTDAPAGRPSGASALQLDAPEQRALDVLAEQGLVPRLRLVAGPTRPMPRSDHEEGRSRDVG